MNVYQNVEEYDEPLNLLKQWRMEGKVTGNNLETYNNSLMTDSEIGFLCGLIKKYRPEKLVEIGVFAGSTSVVILNCIQMLGLSTQMYSIDLAEVIERKETVMVGHMIDESEPYGISLKNHKLMTGKTIAGRLDEIGKNVDFVILDTSHVLPGEVLDFLAIYPILKKDAVVVLHDVAEHFHALGNYATSVLFHSVVADKFLNNQVKYPNIAAFRLNEDTHKYILDVFAGLLMPWKYMPKESDLEEYERVLNSYYSSECLKLYYQAKGEMKNSVLSLALQTPCVELSNYIQINSFDNILLYGITLLGLRCLAYLRERNIYVKGFVVSDGRKKQDVIEDIPIYEYSQIPYTKDTTLILLTNSAFKPEKILKNSSYNWVKVKLAD